MRRTAVAAILGVVTTLVMSGAVLAWTDGHFNGYDNVFYPAGNDNPGGLQGSYCYDNIRHDLRLQEWNEPGHDLVRDMFIRFTQATKAKLLL